jgi:hypothetical protein
MDDATSGPKSRVRQQLKLADELYDLFLDGVAELLAIRHAAREMGRTLREEYDDLAIADRFERLRITPLGSMRLGDLAFDLAKLHVETFKDLTKAGRRHTDFLLDRIRAGQKQVKERRDARERREELLTLEEEDGWYVGSFKITNATSCDDTVLLPQVLAFRKTDGTDLFVVKPEFTPPRRRLAPDESLDIKVRVNANSLHGKRGHFLSETSITMTSGRSLQLYVELVVHGR